MRNSVLWVVFAVAASVAVGCNKDSRPKAETEAETPTPPDAIMATVQLPTGVKMEGLVRAIENIQPGAARGLVEAARAEISSPTGMGLSGVDLDAPISIVIMNPKSYGRDSATLLEVTDRRALEASVKSAGLAVSIEDGRALVGKAAVVKAARKLAFGSLAKPPSEMVVRLYPRVVMAAYKDDLHAALQGAAALMGQASGNTSSGPSTLMGTYESLILALGEQTEVVEVRLGSEPASSELIARLQPRAGSTLEALVKAQVPATHELLGRLPAGGRGTWLMSGEFRAGAARPALLASSMEIFESVAPADQKSALAAAMTRWFDASSGALAVTVSMDMTNPLAPRFESTYLMGANDASALQGAWRELMKLMMSWTRDGTLDMMGMKFDIEFDPNALQVEGIEVARYHSSMNLQSLTEAQRQAMATQSTDQTMYLAAFDDVAAVSMSSEPSAAIAGLVASARGTAPRFQATGATAAELERSKRGKESLIMCMDLGAMLPPGTPMPFSLITFAVGQDQGAMTLRMSVRK